MLARVRDLTSDKDARVLMSCTDDRMSVVLFHRSSTDAHGMVRAMPPDVGMPGYMVDVDMAPKCRAWFGVTQTPAMAVVFAGSILALEYHCNSDTIDRMLARAREQRRLFEALI